jgi:hypothetical protein
VKTSIIACSIYRVWSQDSQENFGRDVGVSRAAQNLAERIISQGCSGSAGREQACEKTHHGRFDARIRFAPLAIARSSSVVTPIWSARVRAC